MATKYESEDSGVNWVCHDIDGWLICKAGGGMDALGKGYDYEYVNENYGPLSNPQEHEGNCNDLECEGN